MLMHGTLDASLMHESVFEYAYLFQCNLIAGRRRLDYRVEATFIGVLHSGRRRFPMPFVKMYWLNTLWLAGGVACSESKIWPQNLALKIGGTNWMLKTQMQNLAVKALTKILFIRSW
ncbi:hypothetical protein Pan2_81 [Pseudanabaena phage Pan2]|nr:hypothetical protein Pan2_81 [Pseudanabaena phage Pan2]